MPMNEKSTPYIFIYTNFNGFEHSSLLNPNLYFDQEKWLINKIEEINIKCPDVPDYVIKRILEKC